MILADTSAWVEFDRGTGSPVDERMAELIAGHDQLAVTEPVVMETLARARDDLRADALRRLLARPTLLRFDSVTDFEAAARIYRRCRRAGITPHGMIDCMIAAVAWRRGAVLLSYDVDLARVAAIIGLESDGASLGASSGG